MLYCTGKEFWEKVASTRKAAEWLRNEKARFTGLIREPICTSADDENLQMMLDNFFEKQDGIIDTSELHELSTFLFDNQHDLIEFDDVMRKELHLRVNFGLV